VNNTPHAPTKFFLNCAEAVKKKGMKSKRSYVLDYIQIECFEALVAQRERENSCGCLWRWWSPDLIKKIGSSYTRCRAPRWRPVMWKRWRSVWRNTRAMAISADNISRRSKPLAPPPLLLLLLLRLLFRLRRCRLPLQFPSPPSALHKRSQPWVRNDESGSQMMIFSGTEVFFFCCYDFRVV